MSRHLGKAAVAARGAAGRQDRAGKRGLLVRPNDDLAAGAARRGRSVDDGVAVDGHSGRSRDLLVLQARARVLDKPTGWAAAAPIAADQNGAAAGRSGDVDVGTRDLDVLAGHHDLATLPAVLGGGQ